MSFIETIRLKRKELGLGVRELCKRANVLPGISEKISFGYYSQIELESVAQSRISIDKIWTLGSVLDLNPLHLFAMSRSIERIPSFSLRSSTKTGFSDFISRSREKIGLGVREAAREISKHEFKMSSGYLSQLEKNDNNVAERISGEKLWAIGCAYSIDPLLLFVLSRKIDQKYLKNKMHHTSNSSGGFVEETGEFQEMSVLEGYKYEAEILLASRNRKVVEHRKNKDSHTCQICGFKLVFRGRPLIECHHLNQISTGQRITTLKDLICLCPTCHRIAHLQQPPLLPEEIKELLAAQAH